MDGQPIGANSKRANQIVGTRNPYLWSLFGASNRVAAIVVVQYKCSSSDQSHSFGVTAAINSLLVYLHLSTKERKVYIHEKVKKPPN